MIRQQIELSFEILPSLYHNFKKRKKFCKTELLNDLILKNGFFKAENIITIFN